MTKQDARSLQAGDKITDGSKVFRVTAPRVTGYISYRADHGRVQVSHPQAMRCLQRTPDSTRKGRR